MNKKEILLIGGGGHCRSLIDVIEQEGTYTIAGIIDKKELVGSRVLDYEIIATEEELVALHKKYNYALVAVGQVKSNEARVRIFHHLKNIGYTVPSIISPLAYLSRHAKVAEGTVLMHHALVNANALVGKNCIINSKALIEHDVIIEEHSHISTAATINGGVLVKANTFVGSNATIREGIKIEGFIKAGSLQR